MIRFIIIILLVFAAGLSAQAVKPVNTNIRMEVLSESKETANEDQYIQVQISCETSERVNAFYLQFENIPARWTAISAQLNGENLWLLKSSTRALRDNVLTWEFDPGEDRLQLIPAIWPAPYVLDIQLQMNLINREEISAQIQEKIIVEADLSSGVFSASPAGRGDMITLR